MIRSVVQFVNKVRAFIAPRRIPARVRIMSHADMMMHIRNRAAHRERM